MGFLSSRPYVRWLEGRIEVFLLFCLFCDPAYLTHLTCLARQSTEFDPCLILTYTGNLSPEMSVASIVKLECEPFPIIIRGIYKILVVK